MNRLFEGYVLRELASYRGTLRALEDGRAHLPSPDDSWVQSQLQLLREHLPGETDLFLLTYGLIVPGVMRGLNPPVLALAENRGGFSPPRRQQAAAQIERLREVLALGSLLAPAREDTSTTLAELHQKLSAFQREPDDDWVAHHAALSEIEVRALTERTLQLHGSHPELATEILAGLAELRAEGLPPEDIRALLKRGCYFPPTLYRNAPPDVVAALTGLLPDPRVSAALEWTRPSELISLRCYHLDAAEDGVPCQAPTGEACHACGGPLVWLFDFTSTPECLPAGAPLRSPCCPLCVCYQTLFFRYDGTWHPATEWSEVDGEPVETAVSYRRPREGYPPFACARAFVREDPSTVGGTPCWLQEPAYPECPGCASLMPFLAQLDLSPEDGMCYCFYCEPCRVGAVTFQQT